MFEIRINSLKPYLEAKGILPKKESSTQQSSNNNNTNNEHYNNEIIKPIIELLYNDNDNDDVTNNSKEVKDEIWKAIDKRFSNKGKFYINAQHNHRSCNTNTNNNDNDKIQDKICNYEIFRINYYDIQSILYDVKTTTKTATFTNINNSSTNDNDSSLSQLSECIDILYKTTSYALLDIKNMSQLLLKDSSRLERLHAMQDQEYKILKKTWDTKSNFLGLVELGLCDGDGNNDTTIITEEEIKQKIHVLKKDKTYPIKLIQTFLNDNSENINEDCFKDSVAYYHSFCNHLHSTNEDSSSSNKRYCLNIVPNLFDIDTMHELLLQAPSVTTSSIIKELIILKFFFQQRYKELSKNTNDMLPKITLDVLRTHMSRTNLLLSFFQKGVFSTIIKIQSDDDNTANLIKEVVLKNNQIKLLLDDKELTFYQINTIKSEIKQYGELLDIGRMRMEMLKNYLELDVERRLNLDCPVVILI